MRSSRSRSRLRAFAQQDLPNWEIHRIVASRSEHLAWMHEHIADRKLSGEELLRELESEAR